MAIQTIEDIKRKIAFNQGRLMARDSGMNYTEIVDHLNEIEEHLRKKLRCNGFVSDEIDRAVKSNIHKYEMLEGAKHQFKNDEYILGCAGEDLKEGGAICQHADDKWYNEKTTSIEPMLNSWAEYVATYSYLTIEEAEKLYPLCKSINMQREQAIALLQSKGDLELLYYTITHEGMIS